MFTVSLFERYSRRNDRARTVPKCAFPTIVQKAISYGIVKAPMWNNQFAKKFCDNLKSIDWQVLLILRGKRYFRNHCKSYHISICSSRQTSLISSRELRHSFCYFYFGYVNLFCSFSFSRETFCHSCFLLEYILSRTTTHTTYILCFFDKIKRIFVAESNDVGIFWGPYVKVVGLDLFAATTTW